MNKLSNLLILITLFFASEAFSQNRTIDLEIGYKSVQFSGKEIKAIAANDQIPAPTLHFKEGDQVTINVHNNLDEETAIHWHGIIIPWQMDGILGISQHGIPPGGDFKYQYTLQQSGTYWYHAHAGLQEQQGLYGAFVIDPATPPKYTYDKDYVIVLSDWSNTHPDKIMANLKKEGAYYSPEFPLQPSLVKFIADFRKASTQERQTLIDDYKMMQQMRMSIYDVSDVAYDAFLLNGKTKSNIWNAPVKVGDVVRLRFIGASGSTIFHVKIPGTTMQMVHADGNGLKPYAIEDFTIAPGETFDVLVKIQNNEPYYIYAESMDKVGAAYGALMTSPDQTINLKNIKPFPEPQPVTREMMSMMMGGMQHDMMVNNSMEMPTEPSLIADSLETPEIDYTTTAGTKYQEMIASVKTNDPNKPIAGMINMELFGYMDRYVWFVNGVPGYQAKPIVLDPAKRYRFVFTNNSMMHHPMHIHGHWFIFRNGNGAYDPLLHTIDVAPGATITADLDTDASGQWFFHCHLLYHMMTGMSRIFQYSSLMEITQNKTLPENISEQTAFHNRPIVRVDELKPIQTELVHHPMAHSGGVWMASFFDAGANPFKMVQKLNYKGLYGSDYNKIQFMTSDAELKNGSIENADLDIFYWRNLDQFWAIKGGLNYFYRPAKTPYWQPGIGLEGLMPYFINTDIRSYFNRGSAKLDVELSRDTQITNNFFIRAGVRSIFATKTVKQSEIGSGLNQMRYIARPYYRLMPGLDLFAEFEHEQDYGPFKTIHSDSGEDSSQNTLTIGFSTVF